MEVTSPINLLCVIIMTFDRRTLGTCALHCCGTYIYIGIWAYGIDEEVSFSTFSVGLHTAMDNMMNIA